VGTRAAEIEMSCCAPAELAATIQGEALGIAFNVSGPVAEIQPVCSTLRRYDVEVRAFIPFDNVGPADVCPAPNSSTPLFFEGDGRGFRADPGVNFRGLPAYRMQQLISVYADERACTTLDLCDVDGLVAGSWTNGVGLSSSYAEDALLNEPLGLLTLADLDEVADDCHLWHQSSTAEIGPGWTTEVVRTGAQGVLVKLAATAGVPNTNLFSHAIDWEVFITIEETSTGPRFTVSGQSDCFPAYEAYVNDKQVLGFMPLRSDPPSVLGCLMAPTEVFYLCSGGLDDPTPPACFQSF
jgi:hypothetical protein